MSQPFVIRHTPLLLGPALSANAGYLNALSIIEPLHQGVSHVTGTVSHLSLQLSFGNAPWTAFWVLVGFLCGAVGSGLAMGGGKFNPHKRYGIALWVEACLIFFAYYLFKQGSHTGLFPLSVACGLQNGLFTAHSKAVIRTTHLTGVLTDLGLAIGRGLRERKMDGERTILYLTLILGFLCGGIAGGLTWGWIGQTAFLVSALYTLAMGLAYWGFRRRHFA
ncbi:MAG: YoaK family protein [bacterium]|nr:YoaK family protein [bacterium]